eukprot:RCo051493
MLTKKLGSCRSEPVCRSVFMPVMCSAVCVRVTSVYACKGLETNLQNELLSLCQRCVWNTPVVGGVISLSSCLQAPILFFGLSAQWNPCKSLLCWKSEVCRAIAGSSGSLAGVVLFSSALRSVPFCQQPCKLVCGN